MCISVFYHFYRICIIFDRSKKLIASILSFHFLYHVPGFICRPCCTLHFRRDAAEYTSCLLPVVVLLIWSSVNVLVFHQIAHDLRNLRVGFCQAQLFEDAVRLGPAFLCLLLASKHFVDISNHKEDVYVVAVGIGAILLADTNELVQQLECAVQLVGAELERSHILEDCSHTFVLFAE